VSTNTALHPKSTSKPTLTLVFIAYLRTGPGHKNPGERSSQYAAEASCRERYGPLTEWMSFIDTDEYLVPMKTNKNGEYNWDPVLDEMDEKNIAIMKLLSSRGLPRVDLME
jgi:hypothetical protein